MNLDERLEQIRAKIAMNGNWRGDIDPLPPLPIRTKAQEDRIEYTLNMFELEKMELIEARKIRPRDVTWAVLERLTAAVKPATLSWCERTTLRIKERVRRIAEWLFRVSR